MTFLRLLADDLTGALDTAAEFVGLTGPVQAFWHGAVPDPLPASAALDSGTRELDPGLAAAIAGDLARHLAGAPIAFKKVDSLMRGSAVVELAACVRAGGWRHCVLAPAFPHQGRITRAGRQHARGQDGDWIAVGGDLIADLCEQGVAAQAGQLDADLPPGVSVFAAETDDELRQVVAAVGRSSQPVLWSGTGGLAQAIADATCPRVPASLPRPVLGLFGSDQPATARQLAACAPHWTTLPNGGPSSARVIASRLGANGMALASFSHAAGTPRSAAGERIAREIERLVRRIEPPGSLVVAGGETLRSLCLSVGATSLEVQGRIVPGVPRSVVRGGRWDGVTVVSKSGAFGPANLLRELLGVPDASAATNGGGQTNAAAMADVAASTKAAAGRAS